MFADAMQTPLHLVGEEATVRGAAMLALEALGAASLDELAPPVLRTLEPQVRYAEIYREAKARQIELYRRLYEESTPVLTSGARPAGTSR